MPSQSWESHFASLFGDFIKAADAGATGIPNATTLPKRTLDEGLVSKVHPRPRLVVSCVLRESTHSRMLAPVILVDVLTDAGGEGGEGGTPPATALQWMQAVRSYLMDAKAWQVFILAQPEERRTGWQLVRRWLAEPEVSDDRDQRTRDYRQPLLLRVAIN